MRLLGVLGAVVVLVHERVPLAALQEVAIGGTNIVAFSMVSRIVIETVSVANAIGMTAPSVRPAWGHSNSWTTRGQTWTVQRRTGSD